MNTIHPLKTLAGNGSLSRPRFKPGLLLEDEDLTAGVDYARNMMRLMFRSLFGCGVVCGLEVEAKLICQGRKVWVRVHKGVALDGRGNLIEVPAAQTIEYDWDCKPPGWPIWVTLCYAEKCCRPKDVSCSIDGDASVVHTRSLDGFEIRLYDKRPQCACSCQAPAAPATATEVACCDDDWVAAAAIAPAPTVTPTTTPTGTRAPAPEGKRAGSGTPSTNCACYEKQLTDPAPCGCDGECECVVIALLDKPKTDHPDVPTSDPTVRRFIRPVPAGFIDCIKTGAAATAPSPPAGSRDPT
jgi:hypothetical protein